MRSALSIATLGCLAVGCMATARPPPVTPLVSEGDLYLVAQPLPPDAARLAFQIATLTALRADGVEVPLRLLRPTLSREDLPQPRLIAQGRLEPGHYAGFMLQIAWARLRREGSSADLLVSKEPLRVEAPFAISSRRATVLQLDLLPSVANDQPFGFQPALAVAEVRAPLAQQSGFSSNSGQHDVTAFDKRVRALSAVIPTGREPWGMALDTIENRLYVALSGEDDVQVFDAIARQEVGRIRLQPHDAPRELALTPDRRLLVSANSGSNTVSFIDPLSMLETGRANVGEAPTGLLMDRAGGRVYVFNQRSTFITIVDLATRSAVGQIATEYSPLRGQLSRDGNRIYVVSARSAYVSVIALPSQAPVGRIYVGLGTTAIKVDPATDLLYAAQGGARRLAVFDPFSLMPIDFISLPADASYLAIADAENTLFALMPDSRSVAAVDLASKRLLAEIDAGLDPRVLVLAGERN